MTDAKDLRFSADYPGALAAQVERETGAPCLFLQGAAGDLSARPPEGVRGPVAFGQALAREVLGLLPVIRCADSQRPSLKVRNEEFTFRPRLDISNPVVKSMLNNAFFPELIAAYEREYRDGVRPRLTVALLALAAFRSTSPTAAG